MSFGCISLRAERRGFVYKNRQKFYHESNLRGVLKKGETKVAIDRES